MEVAELLSDAGGVIGGGQGTGINGGSGSAEHRTGDGILIVSGGSGTPGQGHNGGNIISSSSQV